MGQDTLVDICWLYSGNCKLESTLFLGFGFLIMVALVLVKVVVFILTLALYVVSLDLPVQLDVILVVCFCKLCHYFLFLEVRHNLYLVQNIQYLDK